MLASLSSWNSFFAESSAVSSLIFTPPLFFWGTKVFFTLVGEPFRPARVRSMAGRSAAVRGQSRKV
mgnify:CR=1 FL=1